MDYGLVFSHGRCLYAKVVYHGMRVIEATHTCFYGPKELKKDDRLVTQDGPKVFVLTQRSHLALNHVFIIIKVVMKI